MEDKRNSAYDYACCERVWRRVAPTENPYPNVREEAETDPSDTARTESGELSLPGAQSDPCCMGTAAVESIEVLEGFVRDELAARKMYLSFSRCAPTQEARRMFYAMACDEGRHARELMAAIYLATGETYCPRVCTEQTCRDGYCACLRRFYHEEACGGYNYFRAGEETLDYCLEQMFTNMSKDEYRHARQILRLLSKTLRA
ncbi:MAG: ferritin-like domain-containing protein [Eubacteriales bacterium]|nr:ferritin-like domain-containing protein [Eubacteriales bacterium]